MAKDKKSFILYADFIHVFEELSDKQAGILVKHLFRYVNDQNPQLENKLLKIAFEPIKQQLKRDLKDWEAERSKKQQAGKLGGIKSGETRRLRSKRSKASKNEANEPVTVTVTDNVTVTERENSHGPEILYAIEHCMVIALNDARWVAANKTNQSELEQFNAALERTGTYKKNPADYKSHFSRWKKKENFNSSEQQNRLPHRTTMHI